jgi:uncharacterized protein
MNTDIPLKFRALAAIMHILGGLAPFISIPITWILWITTKELHPFIDRCGRAALNFQASVILYLTVAILLLFTTCGILSNFGSSGQSLAMMIVTYPVFFAIPIFSAVLVFVPIAAAILAMLGKVYSYPLTIKFVSEEQ